MTTGDSQAGTPRNVPLRQARDRVGWTQVQAMRRFEQVATELGAKPPTGPSLRRMFAFWESGKRDVATPKYQDAFCVMYGETPERLGFACPDADVAADPAPRILQLIRPDEDAIAGLEAVTNDLRLVDRRLGSAGHAAVVEAHARQIEQLLAMSVGRERAHLAAALGEAALLAGWLALDRGDVASAWRWHDLARRAALESGSAVYLSHVLAQQAIVLVDGSHPGAARDLAAEASAVALRGVPTVLTAWVLASQAEVLAGAGEPAESRRLLDQAEHLLTHGGTDDLPFVMLDPIQLERWRGHCLAKVGDPAALDALDAAMPSEATSVRAAASLHADLAVAYRNAGDRDRFLHETEVAMRMAQRAASIRQVRRIKRAGAEPGP